VIAAYVAHVANDANAARQINGLIAKLLSDNKFYLDALRFRRLAGRSNQRCASQQFCSQGRKLPRRSLTGVSA